MNSMDRFHPFALFLYFLTVFIISMMTRNPIVLGISLISVLFYDRIQVQRQVFFSDAGFYAALFILLALTNPIFVHKGATPLFFLNGNAVTKEAIAFGCSMGLLLISLLYWSRAFSRVFSSDKVVYLLGNVVPKIALVLSMALQFIPELLDAYREIRSVQGCYLGKKNSWRTKLKIELLCFEALIAQSLENSVEKAISMRARGYGIKRRSFYSIYCFQRKDRLLSAFSILCFALFIGLYLMGAFDMEYYPQLGELIIDAQTILSFVFIFGLMSFAGFLEIKERIHWNYLRSKI